MSETLSLPVLPLDDSVVLPTMVVPLDTSATEARAAIEAAQMSAAVQVGQTRSRRCCWCPGWTASTRRSARSA